MKDEGKSRNLILEIISLVVAFHFTHSYELFNSLKRVRQLITESCATHRYELNETQ